MQDWLRNWDYGKTWYHGSPRKLTRLSRGSTITQDRRLAELFSHKPTWVSQKGDGPLKHNGTLPGWLYVIDDPITADEVYPHPDTVIEPGEEWLTRRELRVKLVGPVPIEQTELLSPQEIKELEDRWAARES
ncbi:MAG: hypothetical protein AMS16_01640 [Planctomycetes bacterium DG_58]|nr:MAG: hypothetical protein AMS16_01640 [Planctomycetes bacterium DG_58]